MMMTELFLLMLFITGKLSVTQAVFTVDNVPVQQGKSIVIPCLYNAEYINHPKYLCFGRTWAFCKDVMQTKHRMLSISDDQTQQIFTVTMKNVTTSDAGQYWCSVKTPGLDVKTSFQLKVKKATPELYVDDQMVTGYEGGHVVISCHHQTKKPIAWCKMTGTCVKTTGTMSGALVQLSSMDGGFTVTMSKLTMNNTGWYWCSAGDEQIPVHITVQRSTPNWERSSFAWLIFLGSLLALACMALNVFRQQKQKCEMFSVSRRSESPYVSMKKPNIQQHEDKDFEAQDYEIMSSPVQSLEVQGKKAEGNESLKRDGGHITY
ncbi:polymeric immunoglobulin receptor isoform X2 [Pangasianodon hypophthalmus]|uniref:polymeric immunoglobulin receptor isoform X2 n=1 Tax=Pangasianodon hypophthalmus TaxID=310915 RepID=UPI002307359D|nr:polymeric immunoglobulin receptor isoform X2 [Pangasianodon hypophthalmus]